MPSPNRRFKDTIFTQLARIGKAVSSPRRLELLDLLVQGPRTVDVLAQMTGQSLANTSHHLQVLRTAQLVASNKRGQFVVCSLAGDDVAELWQAMQQVGGAHLSELQVVTRQFLHDRGQLEAVDGSDLLARIQRGEVTLLDVRPVEEFEAGHLPGALSVPLSELEGQLSTLPPDQTIVAYCRGRYCVLAVAAVQRLRAAGFEALRFEQGVSEWRARGLQVITGGAA